MKPVKITFSFYLSYDLQSSEAISSETMHLPNPHIDLPGIEIPDGSIRFQRIEEYISYPDMDGRLVVGKTVIHIMLRRSLNDTIESRDFKQIASIYMEAVNMLLSFLLLFRSKTRDFGVKPSEMFSFWGDINTWSDNPNFLRFPPIMYDPRFIEKIDLECEPERLYGANAIRLSAAFRCIAKPMIRSSQSMRVWNKSKWLEVCQEFDALMKDASSYSVSEEQLLVDELLIHAYELAGSTTRPRILTEPTRKAISGPEMRAAIVNIAVACEIYVKGYIRKHGKPVYGKIFESHMDFTMPVKEYLDFVIEDIDGVSLKTACKNLWKNIDLLFYLRNKVVHLGELGIKFGGEKHPPTSYDVTRLGGCVEEVISWLESSDKCNFTFRDNPDLRKEIISRKQT
ncbi:hypothetical protein ACFL6S_29260 [Candidatus Poribacteria bacterium]